MADQWNNQGLNRVMNWFKNTNATMQIAFLLIVLMTLSQVTTVINPGERGLRVTLGSVSEQILFEGLAFKLPFVQHIVPISIKQQSVSGETTAFSSDLQSMNLTYQVLYHMPERQLVNLFKNYQGNPFDNLIQPRIEESLKLVASQFRAEDFVKQREKAKVLVLRELRQNLKSLIFIDDMPIKNIDLSDDLEHAIELKQIKEQEALAKRYELDKAKKEAEITFINAEAEAKSVRIKGEALKSSPQVIDLEIVKRWDGKSPTTVVIGNKGGGNVLLPLKP